MTGDLLASLLPDDVREIPEVASTIDMMNDGSDYRPAIASLIITLGRMAIAYDDARLIKSYSDRTQK